jgi:putative antitoxin of VapBC-like toxin-antitoxin system
MKTTLRLDDDLLREAKRRAVETGTTLTHVVEEALRGALIPKPGGGDYEFRPVTVRGTRPPAVDIDDRDALIEFMEGRT